MEKFECGFAKIPNDILDDSKFRTATNMNALKLYVFIITNAGHNPRYDLWGNPLKEGQCSYTRRQVAKNIGCSIAQVRVSEDLLKFDHLISTQKTNKCMIYTDTYRELAKDDATVHRKQIANKSQHSKKLKKKKNIYSPFHSILEYWNSKKIIIHNTDNGTSLYKSAFKKYENRLKSHSHDEIVQAIDNYAHVLHSPDTFFKYKWSLADFLGRENANKFYPDSFVAENFLNSQSKKAEESQLKQW